MNAITVGTVAGKVETSRPKVPVLWAMLTLSLPMLLASLGASAVNVALPALADAFQASFAEVQWIVIAYLLAVTTLIVSIGRIGDIIGRRRVLMVGIIVFTMASALGSLAPTLSFLVLARSVQGVGAAVMMALAMALVSEVVPKEKTGRAMGLMGTMSAIGTGLGPSLGGVLISALGWQAIFIGHALAGLVAFLLVARHLTKDRSSSETVPGTFDYKGALLLFLTLAAYALSMTIGRGHFGLLNIALLMAAVAGISLFVLVEVKAASPLIRLAMFRDIVLSESLVLSGIVSTVVMTTLVVGPFYLSRALELDAATVGIILSAGPLVAALTGLPAGRVVDRFGAQRLTVAGLIAIEVGCGILSMLQPGFGILGYLFPIVVITAGYAVFQTANNTLVMRDIQSDQRGVISGMLNLSRNVGLITGASFMGAVFAFASATNDIATAPPAAVANGMRITFAVAGTLVLTALAMRIGRRVLLVLKFNGDWLRR